VEKVSPTSRRIDGIGEKCNKPSDIEQRGEHRRRACCVQIDATAPGLRN